MYENDRVTVIAPKSVYKTYKKITSAVDCSKRDTA
jgi:hypothetical protein